MTDDSLDYDPEKNPGYHFGRTFYALKQGLRKAFLDHGLDVTPEQWFVLAFLWKNEGMSQCELAEKTTKDRTTITRIVDRLEHKGLIERVRDPKDRRSYRLFPTARSQELRTVAIPVATAFRDKIFGGLPPEDIHAVNRILDAIMRRLEE